MPCRDYEDDFDVADRARSQRDRLARIACACRTELERLGIKTINEEVDGWWKEHKKADAEAAKRKLEEAEKKRKQELTTLKRLQAKYGGKV
jgi:hypothetical protein